MIENKIYFEKRRFYLGLLIIFLSFVVLPQIPYLNLILTYLMTGFICFGIILIVGFRGLDLVRAGILLFVCMLFLELFGSSYLVEVLGNVAYFIILIGLLSLIRSLIKK